MGKIISIILLGILVTTGVLGLGLVSASAQSSVTTFAVIGDYGVNNEDEAAVATMVNGWSPDFIVTAGDNYYVEAGGVDTDKYDLAVGQYYCSFLSNVSTTGTFCPTGQAAYNRFFPALGDHDYTDGGTTNSLPSTYTDYFNLPGTGYASTTNNERYYDFVSGPIHFFILNAYDAVGAEPDGTDLNSIQAEWLRTQLGASTSTWNVVISPVPPYSSGALHGSSPSMQWPFAQWGADAVISGDDHIYERILHDGIVYFVNGLGGGWPYALSTPVEGSQFSITGIHGAQRVVASDTSLTFEFYSTQSGGTLLDSYTVTTPHNTATPTPPIFSTGWKSPSKQAAASGGDGNGYEVLPINAFADDGVFAMDMDSGNSTATACTSASGKDKHKFSNYGIVLPVGAMVQGIEVRADAAVDSSLGAPKLCISLSADNGSTWTNWLNTADLTSAETSYILGSPSNLWGRSWAANELANGSFQVRVMDVSSDNTRDFSLDWLAVNVSYSLGYPTETPTHTATPTSTPTVTEGPSPTPTNTALPPTETDTPTPTATYTSTATLPSLSSTGWRSPNKQAAASSAGDGNGFELNPTYAYSDNGAFATDTDSGTNTTITCNNTAKDKHRYNNYGLSLPSGTAVQGIEVRLDAKVDSTVGDPFMCVALSWDNGKTWSVFRTTPVLMTNETTYLLGGPLDSWSHAWTTSDFSNSSFQVRVINVASDNTRDFSLDWVAVNVSYTSGPTVTPTMTSSPQPPTATPAITDTPTNTLVPTFTFTPTVTAVPLPTTGWQSPGKQTVITGTGDGNGFEINPANAFSNDSVFALDMDSGTTTSTSCLDTGKDRHKFLNYNIALPAGATVQGIEVRLDAMVDATAGTPKMCATVSWDGGATWSAWKSTATLSTTEATYILGAPGDTWGHAWTSTELNNILIRLSNVASDNTRDFSLDWIAVNVTYNP